MKVVLEMSDIREKDDNTEYCEGGCPLKNGRDRGFNYWNLNYRGKFIRTLWMIPLCIVVILLMSVTGTQFLNIIALSVLFIVILVAQLIYNYVKWKNESYNK